MPTRLLPTLLQPVGEHLAIAWNDGTETFVPIEYLRRACPCAACGGEPDVMGTVLRPEVTYTPESFVLKSWQLVGGYAWQPTWGDGHGTGLYAFPYLRTVAAHAAAATDSATV